MESYVHFTDFHQRKRLAESLVLFRLDYCDSVYSPLPGYLLIVNCTLTFIHTIIVNTFIF